MRFSLKDMYNDEVYNKCLVMLIIGENDIFNDIIEDKLKSIRQHDSIKVSINRNAITEFHVDSDNDNNGNIVDIDTFKEVVHTPSINGIWMCSVDYSVINSKQKAFIEFYIRNPSNNGLLIIYARDWKNYSSIVRNRVFTNSSKVHCMNASYADKQIVKDTVRRMIEASGKNIAIAAINYIVFKVNTNYDSIVDIVNIIIDNCGENIDLKEVKQLTKGIENFTISDYIYALTEPLLNDNTSNKKIFRITDAMIEEYGIDNLIRLLSSNIDIYIELRVLINRGIIPIKINYFYNEVIDKISKKSRLRNMKELRFRYNASIAAQTSLEDWVYIKMMLNACKDSHDEIAKRRCLYDIATRSVLSESRINNIVGLQNIIEESYHTLDKYRYMEVKDETN